jgi:RNA polymerase sigma factor (sigma-70 family)
MTQDEELDAILATLGSDLDDVELDRRTARFRGALRRLREDRAEATRIDELLIDAGDDTTLDLLVTRAAAGDPDAWDAIVERCSPLVWSICTQFNLGPSGREDAAQIVWLRLVEQLGTLREPAALPGWLATTTRRECLRQVAAARDAERPGNKPQEERQAPGDSAVEADVLTEERNAVLRAAFAEMPPQWQQLLSMLISDPPYSFAEISASLRIPVGNIGPLRVRALARMRISSQKKQRPASGTRGAGAGPPERRAPDENDGDEPRRDPGGDRP